MGKLVRLSAYRRERRPPPSAERLPPQCPEPAGQPCYYCTRCGAEKFTLGTGGEVQCAGCGALMRNLEVRTES